MRGSTFCTCEGKGAGQLCSNREDDRRLCIRYIDSTTPLLSKSLIPSLWPSSVAEQLGLCWTRSETRKLVFSRRASSIDADLSLTKSHHENCIIT